MFLNHDIHSHVQDAINALTFAATAAPAATGTVSGAPAKA
jgi:hypothetical protein